MPKIKEVTLKEREELEPLLVNNPDYIEQGLKILAQQFPTDSGPLDILAVDSEGSLCVIELKDNVEDEQLDQGIRYYDWVKSNIAWLSKTFKIVEPEQEPRLILVAPGFSDTLKRVARYTTLNTNEVLSLKEYHGIQFENGDKAVICADVEIGEAPKSPEIPTVEKKIDYIQSENVRKLLLTILQELKDKNIEVRPIGGRAMSGRYRGKRFLHLSTRKQWFVGDVQDLNGTWLGQSQISTKEAWEKFYSEKALPVLKSIDER
jgi:hypothetical protein